MRNWPIRTKLLTIPVAAALALGSTAWLAFGRPDHRFAMGLLAFDVLVVSAAIALAIANSLSARVAELREQLAHHADPQGPPGSGGGGAQARGRTPHDL